MKRITAFIPDSPPGVWPIALSCALLFCLLLPTTTSAEVSLRLVHQGEPLPAGTAVVLLGTPGEAGPTGNIQPAFLAMEDYPRDVRQIMGRDTLDVQSRTAEYYPLTQASDQLYFLYAQTPEGRLYGSYSAERGSLKYDVVETGAMSVAPITSSEAQGEIAALFFDEAARARAQEPGTGVAFKGVALGEAQAQETEEEAAEPEVAAQEGYSPQEAALEEVPAETLLLGLGALALFFLLTTLFLLIRYWRLHAAHEDLMATHRAVTAARMTPERIRQLEGELSAMTRKYETVRQSCQTLLERYDRLSNQLHDVRPVANKSEPHRP